MLSVYKETAMAEITMFGPFRHLRAEATSHVLGYRNAKLQRSGRGLAFWFSPWNASLAEVPIDDREVSLVIHARSADFQDVVIQGVLTYRIVDPAQTAERVDFSIDPRKGVWLKQPLEKITLILAQLAQQHAMAFVQTSALRDVLTSGHERIRQIVESALGPASLLTDMGIAVVAVRISSIKPSNDLERALEAPMRERIQEEADEAAFRRRAQAVDKERAIAENELQNQIELARREQQLIEQRGQNARKEATEKAEAARIDAESRATQITVEAEANAGSIKAVEGARVVIDRERLDIYRTMPPAVLAALAMQEVAGKLQRIDHLNLSPDLLGPLVADLLAAGTRKLEKAEAKR
jgi:regulator of protease activity HflC (stomatin/prohibitin superfamily)